MAATAWKTMQKTCWLCACLLVLTGGQSDTRSPRPGRQYIGGGTSDAGGDVTDLDQTRMPTSAFPTVEDRDFPEKGVTRAPFEKLTFDLDDDVIEAGRPATDSSARPISFPTTQNDCALCRRSLDELDMYYFMRHGCALPAAKTFCAPTVRTAAPTEEPTADLTWSPIDAGAFLDNSINGIVDKKEQPLEEEPQPNSTDSCFLYRWRAFTEEQINEQSVNIDKSLHGSVANSMFSLVLLGLSILLMAFGWRLGPMLLFLSGLLGGGCLCFFVVDFIMDLIKRSNCLALGLSVALGGLVLALCAIKFVKLALFSLGAALGTAVGYLLYVLIFHRIEVGDVGGHDGMFWICHIVPAIVCGALALKMQKALTIVATGVCGALMFSVSIDQLLLSRIDNQNHFNLASVNLKNIDSDQAPYFYSLCLLTVVLAGLSIYLQRRLSSKPKPTPADREKRNSSRLAVRTRFDEDATAGDVSLTDLAADAMPARQAQFREGLASDHELPARETLLQQQLEDANKRAAEAERRAERMVSEQKEASLRDISAGIKQEVED